MRGQAVRYAAFSLFSFAMVTGGTVLFVVGLGQGAAGALWGRWIAALIVLVPTLAILRRNARPVFDRAQLRAALAFSLPLVPHLISAWALNFSDRIILGNFVSLDDVGLYAVGYQFGLVVSVLITGMNNAWTPWYFRVSTQGGGAPVPRFATITALVAALAWCGVAGARGGRDRDGGELSAAWAIVPLVVLGCVINGWWRDSWTCCCSTSEPVSSADGDRGGSGEHRVQPVAIPAWHPARRMGRFRLCRAAGADGILRRAGRAAAVRVGPRGTGDRAGAAGRRAGAAGRYRERVAEPAAC